MKAFQPNETSRIDRVRVVSRLALGFVWLDEGLVPKLLFVRPDQIELVRNSGFSFGAPELTLHAMGVAQAACGLWLLIGVAERAAAAVVTAWMCVLIVLVARGNPLMLTDPYGALVKDLCLIACAYTVWTLSAEKSASRSA
ncbi:MAG: DoxX-like family protein [Chthoniobacterales bacterium]|nr:DoxX-like family protein [Chthoniobacterales bacterium]